ncbi:PLxRFG domain-containing protein [Vibrio breoganii]|nr:PLxRFG domain-containing protein [Vibrio breoganii]
MFDSLPNSTITASTDMSELGEFQFDDPTQVKQVPQPSEQEATDYDVSLGDIAKGVGAGALDFVSGVGELGEQTIGMGETLRDYAGAGAEGLRSSMSEDGQNALSARIIKDANGEISLGEGAGDIDVWAMKFAQGIGSLIPTMASGGVTGLTAKALIKSTVTKSMIKRGATKETAEAVAEQTAKVYSAKAGTAGAMGGGFAGSHGSAMNEARENVLNMDHEWLSENSDYYHLTLQRIVSDPANTEMSPTEMLNTARTETADYASKMIGLDPTAIASSALATVGDTLLFKALGGSGLSKGGIRSGALKGGASEAVFESIESGGQRYAGNTVSNEVAGTDIDPMEGVVGEALEGGLIGGGVGGATGAVGGVRQSIQNHTGKQEQSEPDQADEFINNNQPPEAPAEEAPTEPAPEQATEEQAPEAPAQPPQTNTDSPIGHDTDQAVISRYAKVADSKRADAILAMLEDSDDLSNEQLAQYEDELIALAQSGYERAGGNKPAEPQVNEDEFDGFESPTANSNEDIGFPQEWDEPSAPAQPAQQPQAVEPLPNQMSPEMTASYAFAHNPDRYEEIVSTFESDAELTPEQELGLEQELVNMAEQGRANLSPKRRSKEELRTIKRGSDALKVSRTKRPRRTLPDPKVTSEPVTPEQATTKHDNLPAPVTHMTKKGKEVKGFWVNKDHGIGKLNIAKAIDKYTWYSKEHKGFFIREKHAEELARQVASFQRNQAIDEQSKLEAIEPQEEVTVSREAEEYKPEPVQKGRSIPFDERMRNQAYYFRGTLDGKDLKPLLQGYVDAWLAKGDQLTPQEKQALVDEYGAGSVEFLDQMDSNNGMGSQLLKEADGKAWLKENAPAPKAESQPEPEAKPEPKSNLDALDESISQAEADAWADLQAMLNEQKGRLNSGLDPMLVMAFAKASSFTVMKGSVKFAKWVRDAIATAKKLGFTDDQIDQLKPYLKQTYGSIKNDPDAYGVSEDIADNMSSSKELRAVKDIDKFVSQQLRKPIPRSKQPRRSIKKREPITRSKQLRRTIEPKTNETTNEDEQNQFIVEAFNDQRKYTKDLTIDDGLVREVAEGYAYKDLDKSLEVGESVELTGGHKQLAERAFKPQVNHVDKPKASHLNKGYEALLENYPTAKFEVTKPHAYGLNISITFDDGTVLTGTLNQFGFGASSISFGDHSSANITQTYKRYIQKASRYDRDDLDDDTYIARAKTTVLDLLKASKQKNPNQQPSIKGAKQALIKAGLTPEGLKERLANKSEKPNDFYIRVKREFIEQGSASQYSDITLSSIGQYTYGSYVDLQGNITLSYVNGERGETWTYPTPYNDVLEGKDLSEYIHPQKRSIPDESIFKALKLHAKRYKEEIGNLKAEFDNKYAKAIVKEANTMLGLRGSEAINFDVLEKFLTLGRNTDESNVPFDKIIYFLGIDSLKQASNKDREGIIKTLRALDEKHSLYDVKHAIREYTYGYSERDLRQRKELYQELARFSQGVKSGANQKLKGDYDVSKLDEQTARSVLEDGKSIHSDGKVYTVKETDKGWVGSVDETMQGVVFNSTFQQLVPDGKPSKAMAIDKVISKIENDLGGNNGDTTRDGTQNDELASGSSEVRGDERDGATASSEAESGRSGAEPEGVHSTGDALFNGGVGSDTRTFTNVPYRLEQDASAKTEGQRIKANFDALKTLRQIQSEERRASDQEKVILGNFTGWGGIGNKVFDPDGKHYAQVKELMTEAEIDSARSSMSTAFYTSKEIVDAMWKAVDGLNIADGQQMNVLEPTVGTGNFIGYQPEALRERSNWSASELDTVTGNIARLLYPESNVQVKGFEETQFKDGVFSLAIGNPPFGSFQINDKTRPHLSGKKIHNYIIGKSADLLHDNGLMMMVVSNGFLDTSWGKSQLNDSVEFLGAVRLPNDTFKGASTAVVTDIVVMRKREKGEKATASDWTNTKGKINGIKVNKYFESNPSHVLGETTMNGKMYGGTPSMTVERSSDLGDLGLAVEAKLKDILAKRDIDMAEQASTVQEQDVLMSESDLPIMGLMVNEDGEIKRRLEDDANGAVIETVNEESIWDLRGLHIGKMLEHVKNGDYKSAFEIAKKHMSATGRPSGSPVKSTKMLYDLILDKVQAPTDKQAKAFNAKHEKDENVAPIQGYSRSFEKVPALKETLEATEKSLEGWKLGKKYPRVKSLLEIRKTALALNHAETTNADNMDALRKELNVQYKKLIALGKPAGAKVNGRARVASITDSMSVLNDDMGIESGLDSVDPKGKVTKSDIFTQRLQQEYKEPTHAESVDDAIVYSIHKTGTVTTQVVADLMGISLAEAHTKLTEGDKPYLMMNHVTGEYEFIDDYLSGNVKEKHEHALDNGDDKGAELLKSAFPADVTAESIVPNIRSSWMGEAIYEQFASAMGMQVQASINGQTSQVSIRVKGGTVPNTLNAKYRNNYYKLDELIQASANGKTLVAYDKDVEGNRVKNVEQTKKINFLVNDIKSTFETWAESVDGMKGQIAKQYNDKLNVWAERKYNGSKYLKPKGMRQTENFQLRKSQLDGAMRMVSSSSTLLDHVVGAGKTFTAITGIMERKRLGLSKKPLLVVPNHMIEEFKHEFAVLYPSANILTANKKNMKASERKTLFARIASGNYDAIVIGHSHISNLPNDPKAEMKVAQDMIDALDEQLREEKRIAKEEGRRAKSENLIQKQIDTLKGKIAGLQERIQDKDNIGFHFGNLGIDYMVVDEAHEFKNLFYTTKAQNIVGMNDPQGSNKAMDLFTKVRALQDKSIVKNGGLTFMTGTPVSNSLVEVYTMLNYLAPEKMRSMGIKSFDGFADAFLETAYSPEYTAQGTIVERTVLKGVVNGKALSDLYRQFADVIGRKELNAISMEESGELFPVPDVIGGKRQMNIGPSSPELQQGKDWLIMRSEYLDTLSRDERESYAKIDNPLVVMNDARKLGLDPRLIHPLLPREAEGKIARASKSIKALYDKWESDKGTQIVFSDLGTPSKGASGRLRSDLNEAMTLLMDDKKAQAWIEREFSRAEQSDSDTRYAKVWQSAITKLGESSGLSGDASVDSDSIEKATNLILKTEPNALTADTGFSVYDDLKLALIEQGIPENEIAFIHDANNEAQKDELFSRVKSGEVRVIVGSTPKMGAGTNVQERLVALHHLDAPWRPSDMEQREGRIIRQKNSLFKKYGRDKFKVDIQAYTTEGSTDVVMWQILERKDKAIKAFRSGEDTGTVRVDEGDGNSYEDLKAQASGNPVYKEKLKAEKALLQAERIYMGQVSSYNSAKTGVDSYERNVKHHERIKQKFEQALEQMQSPDVLATVEAYQKDLSDYAVAMQNYEANLALYNEMTKEERKAQGLKRPVKPKEVDPLAYSDGITKTLVKMLEGAQQAKDKGIPEGEVVEVSQHWNRVAFIGEVSTNGARLKVAVGGHLVEITQSAISKDLKTSALVKHLLPARLIKLVKEDIAGRQETIDDLGVRNQNNKAILKDSNFEQSEAEHKQAKELDRWLEQEVKLADTIERYRRSQIENEFVKADTRRGETLDKASVPPLFVHDLKDSAGKQYRAFNTNHKDLNKEGSKFVGSAVDQNGEYVRVRVEVLDTGALVTGVKKKPAKDVATTNVEKLEEIAKAFSQPKDDVGEALFNRGERFNKFKKINMGKKQAEYFIAQLLKGEGFKSNNVDIEVVVNESQLPQRIKDMAEKQGATGQVWGVFDKTTRKVYVVLNKHDNYADLEETILHELMGHKAINALFGDNYNAEMGKLFDGLGGEQGIDALIDEFGLRDTLEPYLTFFKDAKESGQYRESELRELLVDELLAHVAERRLAEFAKLKPVKRFWLRVKALLKKFGFRHLPLLPEEQIMMVLYRGKQTLQGPSPKGGKKRKEPSVPAYLSVKKGKDAQATRSRFEKALSEPTAESRFEGAMRSIGFGLKHLFAGERGLGAITLDQLADLSKKLTPAINVYNDIVRRMTKKRNQMADKSANLAMDVRKWASVNKAEADEMFDIAHQATVDGIDPEQEFEVSEYVEKLIAVQASITGQGYPVTDRQEEYLQHIERMIEQSNETQDAHKTLRKRFNALSPQARAHYVSMRKAYAEQRDEQRQLLLDAVARSELSPSLKKQRITEMRQLFEQQDLNGPYFPLARFGDYWLETKDEEGERHFMMYESEKEQQDAKLRLEKAGFEVQAGMKTAGMEMEAVGMGFVSDLMVMVDDKLGEDSEQGTALKDAVYQLYLQTLPSRSLRKNSLHRKKVKGWSNDALRALATNLMKGAYQISRLEFSEELSGLVREAGKQAKKSQDNQAYRYVAELEKRHEWVMNPKHSNLAGKLTGLGFLYMLGVSPASAGVNLSQNFVVALPVLSSKFGMKDSAQMLSATMAKYVGNIKNKGVKFKDTLKGDEKRAYNEWHDLGLLDDTNAHSLSGMAEAQNWEYSERYEWVMDKVSRLFHEAEVLNRETTAISVYRLARKQGQSHEQAVKLATELTWKSHFDYSNTNRARYAQSPVAKVALQFKQYSQNITYYLWRNLYQSFKGNKTEMKEARKQLIGTLGMTALMGGMSALPLWAMFAIANLSSAMFTDDDEPFDAETEFYSYLKDALGLVASEDMAKDLAYHIRYGSLGAGVSSRISLDGLWVRDPNRDLEGEDTWSHYAKQVAGPVMGGVVLNAIKGADWIAKGEVLRGIETASPKFMKDGLKAYRFGSDGALNYSGRSIVAREDMSYLDLALQGIGLTDGDLMAQYQRNSEVKRYEQHISRYRSDLLTAYWLAFKSNDQEAKASVIKKVKAFNRKFSKAQITSKSISASIKTRMRLDRQNEGGIVLKNSLRDYVPN